MNENRTVFAQWVGFSCPRYEVGQCVQLPQGHCRIRQPSCYNPFLGMPFAQLTGHQSLSDTLTCLKTLSRRRSAASGLFQSARLHDVNILDRLAFEQGAISVFDRASSSRSNNSCGAKHFSEFRRAPSRRRFGASSIDSCKWIPSSTRLYRSFLLKNTRFIGPHTEFTCS